jgi:hypothetical protein
MDVLDVALGAAALLLLASGPWKLARPDSARRALRLTGLPASDALVRGVGTVELVVGAGVVLDGDRSAWPAALGVVYAGFAAFVVLALWRRAPLSSCGCFGSAGVAPTPLHAGIDAGFAAIGFVTAVDGGPAPLDVVTDGGTDAIVLVAGALALAAAVHWIFTRWPGTTATR